MERTRLGKLRWPVGRSVRYQVLYLEPNPDNPDAHLSAFRKVPVSRIIAGENRTTFGHRPAPRRARNSQGILCAWALARTVASLRQDSRLRAKDH